MRLIARGCCVAAVGCLTLWVARRRPRTVGTTTTTTPRGFFLLPRIQSYCSAPLSSGREGLAKGELWGATVCIRHGARSAIHTELADDRPFDCALSPLAESVVDGASNLRPEIGPKGCLPGQLLDRGFEQHVALGTFFRNRYGGAWTANARSTDYQRTRASAAAFLTGFTGTPPASIESRSVSEPMLGVDEGGIACDRAARLAAAQRDAFVPAANLTPFWPNDDLSSGVTRVADAVYSRACEKQEPSCASGRCLDDPELVATLLAEADRHFCARYLGTRGGGEATRLSAYAFLREIVDGLLNRPARHLTLYSGHDTVVAPLAAALGFFDCRWPPLASRIVFELWQKNEVRILYNGIDVTSKVPGCDATRCPLPVLSAAVDALIAPAHVAVAFVPPSPQPRGFLHVVVVQQRRAQEVVVAEERPPPTTTSSMPPPPPPTMLFADECSSVDESDKERCLSSLSAKVQETLLASTLDIQVPGPGASREGSYFQGPPAKALKINLDILNYRAKRELKRGQVASARRLWQQCLEIDKYDGRAWLALSRDAEKTRRDPRLAAQYLLECLRYAPANAYVRQAYGILLERQGMRKQALEQYDRALAYDPSHAASWVAKARLLERRFRTPSYLAHDVLSDETDTETEPSRRRVYFSVSTKGDAEAYEEARRCYAQALRVDPTNGQALVASGMFEAGAGRVDAARRLFRRAVEANPRNAASYAAWAKVEEHERPRDARRFYAAAHAAHPSNTRALTSWARFELRQGNASAAVEILHKATRVRTGRGGYRGGCVDGDVFATLGEITWKHFGDARRARDAFRRAINVDASVPRAYLSWASMETRLGRLDFARDILQQGIWGVTTGVSDRRRVADLWRAAARVEVAAAKRGSFANATTVDAVRAAFREALDLVSQRADLASDGGKLAASVFLEWANFEALLPGGRHRQVLEDALHTLPNDPHLRSALETADRGPSSSSSASSSKRPATWGKAAVPNDAGRSPSGGGGA